MIVPYSQLWMTVMELIPSPLSRVGGDGENRRVCWMDDVGMVWFPNPSGGVPVDGHQWKDAEVGC